MSYQHNHKKTTLLHQLQSAIKRKTLQKNRHRDIANKNVQYSIQKKNNQSKERVSSSTYKHNQQIDLNHLTNINNRPVSIFNNNQNHPLQNIKQSLSKQNINKLKKTNSKKLDKLISLINYALSSADKIIKYMNTNSFQGQFAVKLFKSDKQNLLNQLKNITVQDIIQYRQKSNSNSINAQMLTVSNQRDKTQLIIDLQNDNIKLKTKISTLQKQLQALEKFKFTQDIFQSPNIKLKQTQRFKETLQILTGSNFTKKVIEILQKQSKFELIAFKNSGNQRKMMEVQAILKSLKMERMNLLKQYSPQINNEGKNLQIEKINIFTEDDSLRIMQLIKNKIRPYVNPNLFNYSQILEEFIILTEEKLQQNLNSGRNINSTKNQQSQMRGRSVTYKNNTTSKQELKKQLSNLRQKFNQIQGKAKVYQENQLLKLNIDKVFQQLKRICLIFLPDNIISQQDGFQTLLQKIQQRVRLSIYKNNKSKTHYIHQNQNQKDQIDLKQLQLKIQQQCKNNSSLKKINISLMQDNNKLSQKLTLKEKQLTQFKRQNLIKHKQQSQQIQKSINLKLQIQQLKQNLKNSEIRKGQLQRKLQESQVQKDQLVKIQCQLRQNLRISQNKITNHEESSQNTNIQNLNNNNVISQVKFDKLQKEIEEYKMQIQNLKNKIESFEVNQDYLKQNISSLQQQLQIKSTKNETLKQENNGLVTQLMSSNQKINQLIQNNRNQKKQIQSELRKQIKQIQFKNQSFIKQLQEQIQSLQKEKQSLCQTNKQYQKTIILKQQALKKLQNEIETNNQNNLQLIKQKSLSQQHLLLEVRKSLKQKQIQIDNLNQRLETMKINDKSLKSQNTFLQKKIQQIQNNYKTQIQQLSQLNQQQLKQKNQLKLALQLKQKQFKIIQEKLNNKEDQDKLLQLESVIKIKENQLKQLTKLNEELTDSKLKQMQKCSDLQQQLQQQKINLEKYRDQYCQVQNQLQMVSGQLILKGQKQMKMQQQIKIKNKRIIQLTNQKERKSLNEKTYCNLIKRILRSQIDTEQFEDMQDFQKLLQLGSRKVMQQRKRKRQQQSIQRKKVFIVQNQSQNKQQVKQQDKRCLFNELKQRQDEKQKDFDINENAINNNQYNENVMNMNNDLNIEQFGEYKDGLNESIMSQRQKINNCEDNNNCDRNINNIKDEQGQGNDFDQFNDINSSLSNNNSSFISNNTNHQINQREGAEQQNNKNNNNNNTQQQSKDINQFNDYNSQHLNSSLVSHQDISQQKLQQKNQCKQYNQQHNLSNFNDISSQKNNSSLLSNNQQQQQQQHEQHHQNEQQDIDQFNDYQSEKMSQSFLSQTNNKLQNRQTLETHQIQNINQFNQFQDKSSSLNKSNISANSLSSKSLKQLKAGLQKMVSAKKIIQQIKAQANDFDQFNDYQQDHLNDSVLSQNKNQKQQPVQKHQQDKGFQQFADFNDKINHSLISQGQHSQKGPNMNNDLSAIQFDEGTQQLGNSHLSQFFHNNSPVKKTQKQKEQKIKFEQQNLQ